MEAQAAPFLEWVWVLPDDPARWLSVDDGWTRDGIARTDVKITPDPARALLRAGPTANETAISLDFSFNDALLAGAPRTIVVEREPGPSSIRLYALGLALGLALIGGLWAFGRRGKTRA